MLYLIGLGLDNKEITEKGWNALETAEKVYAEFYTNTENIDLGRIEEKIGKEVKLLSREEVEQEDKVLETSENKDTAFLVSGNPLTATTHYGIKHRAEKTGIDVEVVHAPSIFTSVSETGLNVYKFGRTVTLPEEASPESVIDYIEKNSSIGLHTLVLLDIDYSVEEAAKKLVEMKEDLGRKNTVVIERANHEDQEISTGKLSKIAQKEFGETPHSLIIVGKTSHMEKEFLESHNE